MLLRLPLDPTSATGIRAADPDWHRIARQFVQPPGPARRRDAAARDLRRHVCPQPHPLRRLTEPSRRSEALHDLVLRSLDDDQASGRRLHPLDGQIQHRRSYGDRLRALDPPGRVDGAEARRADQAASSAATSGSKGLPVADWVLIDADDVIVHLFRPEVRSFYNLERMWAFEGTRAAAAAHGNVIAAKPEHRRRQRRLDPRRRLARNDG